MADEAETQSKILAFLMEEWVRRDNRQLVGVDLFYAPGGGYKDEPVRSWERADTPEFFAEMVNVERLASQILDIAQGEVDAKPAGKHRFVLRTRQHMGTKPTMSFALYPSFHGAGDETSLVAGGAGAGAGGGGGRSNDIAAAQILAGNNSQLMRINAQMFDAALRPLAQQNQQLLTELIALRAENSELQRKLAEAEANKSDREFQIAMAMEKNARANAGFQKLLQLGTVVAAKIGAGSDGASQLGEGNPLAMLLGEFYQSLRQEQLGVLMQTLDMGQKIMFMEIVNHVRPPDKGQGQSQQPPGGPSGARP